MLRLMNLRISDESCASGECVAKKLPQKISGSPRIDEEMFSLFRSINADSSVKLLRSSLMKSLIVVAVSLE